MKKFNEQLFENDINTHDNFIVTIERTEYTVKEFVDYFSEKFNLSAEHITEQIKNVVLKNDNELDEVGNLIKENMITINIDGSLIIL